MKRPHLDTEPLTNQRHEAFAQEVASGRNAAQAYAIVYGIENPRTASAAGYRLLGNPVVVARVKSIQQAGAQGVAMDLRQIHYFLTRVVLTPAGSVDSSSDLCMRVKVTKSSTDTWMPSKLACLQTSAKLQGFFPSRSQPAKLAPSANNPHLTPE